MAAASVSVVSKTGPLGYDDRDPREFVALHQLAGGAVVAAESAAVAQPRSGDIAILNDNGSLVVGSNSFDLGGVGLRFEPNGQGGYDVTRSAASSFRPDLGRRLSLGDDATTEEALAFGFSFYGASRGSVFVNPDGNLSFTRGDAATDERSLGRVLGGPPRAALFFAETLNPEALVGVLHDFLNPMSEIIVKHEGTIDKYIGVRHHGFVRGALGLPGSRRPGLPHRPGNDGHPEAPG